MFLIIFGIVQLASSLYFSLTAEDYTQAIANYFKCNLHGNKADCTIEFNAVSFGIVYVVGTVTDMAIPWVLFFYIIKRETIEKITLFLNKKILRPGNFKKIKDLCCSKKVEEQSVTV